MVGVVPEPDKALMSTCPDMGVRSVVRVMVPDVVKIIESAPGFALALIIA